MDVAGSGLDDRHFGIAYDSLDESGSAARDQHVDVAACLHHRRGALASVFVDGVDQRRVESVRGERVVDHRHCRRVRALCVVPSAQYGGVAGFEAQAGHIHGHVRPGFVDHADNADGHVHLIEPQPVLQRVSALDLADRIGQRGHVANAFGAGGDARLVEPETVELPGVHAPSGCGLHVLPAMVEASASSASAIACSRAFFIWVSACARSDWARAAASAFAQTPENTSPFNSSFVIKPRITQIASFAGHSCHHVNMGARVLRPRRTPVCGTRRRHAHA